MTGFSRADGASDAVRWHWELRTVNSRGLDVRMRISPGFERLEVAARARIQKRLARGSCTAGLTVRSDAAAGGLIVNHAALQAVLAAAEKLRGHAGIGPATADGLLGLRGVLELEEPDVAGTADEALDSAILGTLDNALDQLIDMRGKEGERLGTVVDGQIRRISDIVDAAEALPSRTPDQIRNRLDEQLRLLLEGTVSLDADRLHQEAALLATKADIREELDRLRAHVEAARDLLASGEPVGRRLDFLTQEFNREANTICSKSGDIALTRLGLELKSVIDQLREQVQNVE